ncbi:fatty-acid amide hydrolase 1-like isoform X3 [Babylonia areolata]|uniref:fatty-acid amide hydrolase 1-like isoform X3 n=1 Tax=Babylonia areolata TaxID=304850 RepID=UPI003FD39731
MPMFLHGHGHHHLAGRVSDCLEDIQPGLTHKVVGGVVIGAALSYVAVRGYRYYRARQIGKERGLAAKKACQKLKDYLNQQELNREKDAMIVSLGMDDLKAKLQKGELKAVEVLRAYQRKALEVNDQLNCITEPIVEAEAMAKQLDQLRPEQRGPLHGIPVSIKESIFIKGYDCTVGFTPLVGKPADKDADIVQLLKSLGAVPFVRTNIPQGLLAYACSNPIFGRTSNPYCLERGPGGSSGGEGALLGAGGSIIGIGSDIGGSVRVPATFCGAYSLKATAQRALNKGHLPLLKGETAVLGSVQPMARDMASLIQLTRGLYTQHKMHDMDSTVPPISFRDEVFEHKGPLRIGFYTSIEGMPAHPTCVRAVLEAKDALEQKGHQVVPFKPPRAFEAFCELMVRGTSGDGGADLYPLLKDDPLDTCVSSLHYMGKLPLPLKYLISKLLCFTDPLGSKMCLALCRLPKTVVDWWQLEWKKQLYLKEFEDAWKHQKLDAVICPVMPHPAVTAGFEEVVFCSIIYTALYNLLNYPAGSVPVTTVTQQDLQRLRDPSVFPCSGLHQKFMVKDSEGSEGLPVGVQCVSLPFQEEMVLRIMKEIDSTVSR